MNLIGEFRAGVLSNARAVYRRDEIALECAVDPEQAEADGGAQAQIDRALGIRPASWFGIADTLVMEFSDPDATLVAIDAYTNIDRWTRGGELQVPDSMGTGRVCLAHPPRDSDRIDLGVVPEFRYSESLARLRITFGRHGDRHYRVSTCLVVGMDDEGITSLDLSNLRVE